jgi:hypothetical protein
MKPTKGRIVIWKNSSGEEYAAIVTKVWTDDCINVGVFSSTYTEMTSVMRGDKEHQWNWPVRE